MTELIYRAKNGDGEALQKIFEEYKELIRSIVNKFYLAGGDKDDLLQEAMIGLFKAVCDFDETRGAFPSFVRLCVVRQVISAVKTDAADKNKPLAHYVELSEISAVDVSGDPLELLIEREWTEKIQQAIATDLTPAEKNALALFLEGYGYEDISAKLHVSYKAVDGALQRARKKLLNAAN